jgi:isopenicillin N synthase-like dioxygenase
MSNFFDRKAEITEALWAAATDIGFFQLTGHAIPETLIDEAFRLTAGFFDLPEATKAQYPLRPGSNAGWEFKEQTVQPNDADGSVEVVVYWPTRRRATRSRCHAWRGCGPRARNWRASRPPCSPSSGTTGRWA